MRRRTGVVAVCAAAVALVAIGAGILTAANPKDDKLPPEKQALEDFAAANQANAPIKDKAKDPGRPVNTAIDVPPDTGLLGPVNAPVPGGVFTPTNEWAGWVDATAYLQVYAGDSPENPNTGVVFVVRRFGSNGHLDPNLDPVTTFINPPAVGGPLKIVRVEGGELIIANPGGHEFRFNPAAVAFD